MFPFDIDETFTQIDLQLAKIPMHHFSPSCGYDDLRHDIFVLIMERVIEFDPNRASWLTFQSRIIRGMIEDFILSKRWLKNQTPDSFETLEPDELPLINVTHSGELDRAQKAVFAEEVQTVINTIPEQLRECCERLKHYSLSETANMLNIAPNILQHDIKKIRVIFRRAKMSPEDF